jgi:single-strand DNA-binding protein
VLVEGRLKLDQWDDKQTGQKRSRLKVVAMRLQFLGPPPQGGARPAGAAPAAAPASATPKPGTTAEPAEEPGTEPEPDLDIQEEQIPF